MRPEGRGLVSFEAVPTGHAGAGRPLARMHRHIELVVTGSGVESDGRVGRQGFRPVAGSESVVPRTYVGDQPGSGNQTPRRGRVNMTSTQNLPGRLLILLVALVATLLLLGGTGAASEPSITVQHRVVSGDTLWTIATEFTSPGEDVRASVALLRELNGLSSSALNPGQVLVVPAG